MYMSKRHLSLMPKSASSNVSIFAEYYDRDLKKVHPGWHSVTANKKIRFGYIHTFVTFGGSNLLMIRVDMVSQPGSPPSSSRRHRAIASSTSPRPLATCRNATAEKRDA